MWCQQGTLFRGEVLEHSCGLGRLFVSQPLQKCSERTAEFLAWAAARAVN